MATVNVDRRLLWTLAGVAGLSLLAVVYLLGRASGGGEQTAPRPEGAAPASAASPAGSGGTVPTAPSPPPSSAEPVIARFPISSVPHFAADAVPEPPAPAR